jgi:surface protein
MFNGCSALVSLKLSNFNTAQVTNMTNMFNGCNSLNFINLLNYQGKDIFSAIANNTNLKVCLEDFSKINGGQNSLQQKNITICCK